MIILFIFSIPMYYIHVPTAFSKNPEHRLEDLFYAFKQINEKPIIILALFLVIVRYFCIYLFIHLFLVLPFSILLVSP